MKKGVVFCRFCRILSRIQRRFCRFFFSFFFFHFFQVEKLKIGTSEKTKNVGGGMWVSRDLEILKEI